MAVCIWIQDKSLPSSIGHLYYYRRLGVVLDGQIVRNKDEEETLSLGIYFNSSLST